MAMMADADWPFISATMNSVIAEIAVSPPARPSMPSEKLMTVVTPKIQTIVSTNCRMNGREM
ncbi:hypothetical protein D3C74_400740 [compost metagenome]